MQLLVHVTLCLIKKVFLLKALWKVEQVLIDLVKHGWHFPLLDFFKFKIFLLSKTLLFLIISLRFPFLLNAKIGGSAKMYFNFGSICKICQFFFSIIVLRSGRILLYVTVTGKSSVLDVLILFSNLFLGIEIAPSICVVISILL